MNQLIMLLLIGAAGAIGAWTRFGTSLVLRHLFGDFFPLGTMVVNISGCFLLGLLLHLHEQFLSAEWKMVIGIGFLGALTTFSTFGAETIAYYEDGHHLTAFFNIVFNLVFGLTAVLMGIWLAGYLGGKS